MATSSYQSREVPCPKCGKAFHACGIKRHISACTGTLDSLNSVSQQDSRDPGLPTAGTGTAIPLTVRDQSFEALLIQRRRQAQDYGASQDQVLQRVLGRQRQMMPQSATGGPSGQALESVLSAVAPSSTPEDALSRDVAEDRRSPIAFDPVLPVSHTNDNIDETPQEPVNDPQSASSTDNPMAPPPVTEKPRDIKIVWHPHADIKGDQHIPYAIFRRTERNQRRKLAKEKLELAIAPQTAPWYPFTTLSDFETAELSLNAQMNEPQTSILIDLLKRAQNSPSQTSSHHTTLGDGGTSTRSALFRRNCTCPCANHPLLHGVHFSSSGLDRSSQTTDQGQESSTVQAPSIQTSSTQRGKIANKSFGEEWDHLRHPSTIRNTAHMNELWDVAIGASTSLKMRKVTLNLEYRSAPMDYDVWLIDLWDWCLELMHDPKLINHFEWDARRMYAYNGSAYERLFDEPWTADGWWDVQSVLPSGVKPFCILLYSDKTRLSSFGTAQGYPVLACCLNLPVDIRNSDGIGGGKLVGWLPIVKDEAENDRKKDWINFRRLVWHSAFAEIIKSLKKPTEFYPAVACADGLPRQISPHVLMISADYDEHTMVTLIRGTNSNRPCPVCLIDETDIAAVTLRPEADIRYRTHESMKATFERARLAPAKEKEKILKDAGLRDVENVFWKIKDTNVYAAVSWDRLHSYHLGLWEDHLLVELKAIILSDPEHTRRDLEVDIDEGLSNIPRYRGLIHFTELKGSGGFADGRKHEDLSKSVYFAMQQFVVEDTYKVCYAWLRLLASYHELDMFSGLTVQTESTIERAVQAFREFDLRLSEYVIARPESKGWTFPKRHTHAHMIRDIIRKGVTRNYSTKPGEKANAPLKKIYRRQTNFKNIESQLFHITERNVAAITIRDRINNAQSAHKAIAADDYSSDSASDPEETNPTVLAGASQDPGSNDTSGWQPPSESLSHASSAASATAASSSSLRVFLYSKERPSSISAVEEKAKAAGDGCFHQFRQKLSAFVRENAIARGVNIPNAMRALAALRRDRNALQRRGPGAQALITGDDEITRFNTARIRNESIVDWRNYHTIIRAHPSFAGTPRHDYVMVNLSDDETIIRPRKVVFGQIRLMFTFSLVGVVEDVQLALFHPFNAPLTNRLKTQEHDKVFGLTRLQARPESHSIIIPINSIIRSVLLVPVLRSLPQEYLVFNLLDQDLWTRCKNIELSISTTDL